ncbi:MAG: CusA/CzcA family heavy metal efflux RND transporter [Bacteroidetes bacterium]|nr:CusA/CzcA family heavy metal efflux RND transporter [Bacteroidota bacterium]MBU1115546.1 CusA/CzcA family heavy metal efflux RND transporter [Bacteroidota bacterium]MBU1797702.1 CusA/CzcA family heavy metal efflux RND transporter [Bacteroidota bacterium]
MNKIIDFALKNRLLITVLAIVVFVGGYFSYNKLLIDAFPDVSPSLVQVFTVTEGLAPEEVEKYVTFPIESALNGLPNLENIRSVSNFGLSVVNIYFEDGTDIYFARQIVNERLQEAREQIPEGFGDPQMGPISTGMGLILFYYLEDTTGTYTLTELRTIQDWIIKYQLQTVPGVTEVLGIGGWEKQFHIVVNPNSLLRYDIAVNDLVDIIKKNNLNVGASYIERDAEEFLVRSVGLATKIEDLENIVIKSEDGTPIYLNQVSEIKIGGAIRRGLQTRNGIGEVVSGQVVKLFGTNSSTVISDVEKKMAEINKTLPEGIKIVPYYEQKSLVEAAVSTVTNALLQGIALVVIVLILLMGSMLPSVVVALSIPFSVLFAFIGMEYFGISINLMSFGGLAIAIGMMVDGSIVLVENVDRLKRESSPDENFIYIVAKASKEVLRPIIFSIVIIITVFIPLFTLHGVEGKTFRPLAYTIALAMLGSLIFAMFLAPVYSSFLLKQKKKKIAKDEPKENFIIRLLLKIYNPVVKFFVKTRIAAVVLGVIIIIVGIFLYPRLGSEFTPTLQEGTIVVKISMAPSISLEESKKTTLLLEKIVNEVKEVNGTVTRIGRGEVGAHTDPINSAEITVLLKPESEWREGFTQADIEEAIREKLSSFPGILVNFTQPIQMSVDELLEGVKAELAVKLFGDDLNMLKYNAERIAATIRAVEGAADIQVDQISGKPQLKITVNRHAIARYGLNLADVQQVIKTAIGGETSGQIFEGIRRFDIFVRLAPEYRNNKAVINELLISTPTGMQVPLSQVADIEEIEGPRQITREQNQRFIIVQCNVVGRDIGGFVEEAQKEIDEKVNLPVGYYTTWGGQYKLQQEANKRFALVIPITLLIVFFLLYSSFNSMKNTLLIFINIPLALVGGVIALWLTNQNLSVPSSVGFIALFGIALQNGMVLVTYLNQLLRGGMPIDEASIEGAKLRLRPVLMTALTTMLGLMPLLLGTGTGSEVQRPLATVVIGGLFTSTILTLIVLPALYKWFPVKVQSGEM